MKIKGSKITVMGLGLHGGGAAVVKWLAKSGANVVATDLKTKSQLQPSIDFLKDVKVEFVLGKHREKDFTKIDFLVKNPGVPNSSRFLKLAQKNKIPIENDASLFFKNTKATVIGVTGTRGKSTTTSLIYNLLKQAGKKVYLAGLSGQPMFGVVDKVNSEDFVVLELSSWQLEVLGSHKISPHVAVITNIYPDHLNRHTGMADYISAKKNIFKFQKNTDFSIFNLNNPETKKMGSQVRAQRLWFSKKYFDQQNGSFIKNGYIYLRYHGKESKIASLKDIKLKGEHNLENILAALNVCSIYKIKPAVVKKVLRNFSGLPGRNQIVGKVKNVTYINDTTSTMPQATLAALAQSNNKQVVLIAGGDFKNIPDSEYRKLADVARKKCRAIVLFSGKGSEQFIQYLKGFSPLITQVETMVEAVSVASSLAKAGNVVVLSPACASFNLFKNEFDRGDQFNQAVKELK